MEDIAGWVAPGATMIAAMMTAANLGARLTGWGFVVFSFGSVAWTIVGLTSGQANLVASNAFLTLVNIVGVWRWLGRQAGYEEGARSAKAASRASHSPTLFTATGLQSMSVMDNDGRPIGRAVEALLECAGGTVSYVVVATGGLANIEEELRAVDRRHVQFGCDTLKLDMSSQSFEGLPVLRSGEWPATVEHAAPEGQRAPSASAF